MSPTTNVQDQSLICDEAEARYCVKVLQRLNTFRYQGLLCDVTITAEDRDFAAHKGILSASSDYFQALFTTAMIEKNSEKINLDVSSSIVNELLTFLYTGKTDINESNVVELLVAADYLVIHELKEQCADYLVHLLSTVTCIKIFSLALQCHCPVLRVKAERFILCNFVSVLESEDLQSLDCNQLECILKNGDLIVNSEEDVYEAILLWMNGYGDRKPYFERLFSHIRLCSLSEDFVMNIIENEPLVRQSSACMSLIHQRLQSTFANTDDKVQVLQPRKCLRKEFQGLVVVGGKSEGKVLKDTLVLNPNDKSWSALAPSECEREEHLVVACKGRLYVIGGMKRSQSIDCYDPSSNIWSTVAHLPEKAITSAGVCLDGKIFIMGGKNGYETMSWVQCFDPSNNQLQRSAPMTFPRKALCAVALDGEIYAIGGCTCDNDSLNVVEKMNPNRHDGNEWKQISPLREHRKYACAEVLANKKILVVGGYQGTNQTALDSCEVYSTETKEWQMVCSLVLPRAASAMACIDNQLYVVGGRSDRRSTDTIEYYDEDNNQWCMSPVTLPYPCAWIQCTVLDVPKTLLHGTAQTQ
ncbi:kelch-like protein diablo [Actinia tenebrosa]|uniref:Kelch-like protein diablo n=1 Tax=Actinia tenebrosa TaxID=6105 RepID=A0A6P8ITY1_ACTTE|nr:kelch-like protein diablo [Actinia tenebrosa]